eukprot:6211460-Pleurochrysis_carterae.AAC.1
MSPLRPSPSNLCYQPISAPYNVRPELHQCPTPGDIQTCRVEAFRRTRHAALWRGSTPLIHLNLLRSFEASRTLRKVLASWMPSTRAARARRDVRSRANAAAKASLRAACTHPLPN